MRHSIRVDCIRYRLRPVAVEDASFIVAVRTDHALNRFVHEVSGRVEDQVTWLQSYFDRAGDYYFIVEDVDSCRPQGTIGLYNRALGSCEAEWGRWILRRDSMAALESAWLICETAFSILRLSSICSRTLAENQTVISFHDSFGASREAVLVNHFTVHGEYKTAIEHRITAAEWPLLRARHYSTVSRLARVV